ncbi:I78 family peptidase inhibitor [Pseudoxanthomonas beigongshangi]|uniref:I78 family peptidase inhibitor n=1 Tax=Pseudoxanthomonas beigongshangi TaxID=2782537 RepID=UPI00193B2580|nr:I78 family peptidase inhibitor [Pseudoxanthomonas beigongshangi]
MSRYAIPALLLSLTLAACSAPAPDEQTAATEQSQAAAAAAAQPPEPGSDPTGTAPAPGGSCDDTQAQWIIGKAATPADTEQAGKDAKANAVRTLKPGEAATMDFNPSRLNIDLDDKGMVTAVRCG